MNAGAVVSNVAGSAATNAATGAATGAATNAATGAATNAAANTATNAATNTAANTAANTASNATNTAANAAGSTPAKSTPTTPEAKSAPSSSPESGSPSTNGQGTPENKSPQTNEPSSEGKGIEGENKVNPDGSEGGSKEGTNPDTPEEISEEKTPKEQAQEEIQKEEEAKEAKEEQEKELEKDHKQLDENGQAEDNSKVKLEKAAVTGVATYFGGGKGAQIASSVNDSGIADKLYGVVDDATSHGVTGKVLDAAANELDEAGLTDGINDAASTFAAATSGDIKKTIAKGKDTLKDVGQAVKYTVKKTVMGLIIACLPILFGAIIVAAVCGPVLGGFMDVTSAIGNFFAGIGEGIVSVGEWFVSAFSGNSNMSTEEYLQEYMGQVTMDAQDLLSEVPDYDTMTGLRKGIVTAAATGVASKAPYKWGGKPTQPGLEGLLYSSGLDCSGFVQWTLWTATGQSPGTLSTSIIGEKIGDLFYEVSESDLKPGDIGLKHKGSGDNHTGIYAGNGMWFHAANTKQGIIRSGYKEFTVFLRYKEVDG